MITPLKCPRIWECQIGRISMGNPLGRIAGFTATCRVPASGCFGILFSSRPSLPSIQTVRTFLRGTVTNPCNLRPLLAVSKYRGERMPVLEQPSEVLRQFCHGHLDAFEALFRPHQI